MSDTITETTRITNIGTGEVSTAHRQVCWEPDRSLTQIWEKDRWAHRCHLDLGHNGDHQDDCCEHGLVTWPDRGFR